TALRRYGAPELFRQRRVEGSEHFDRYVRLPDAVGSPAEVYRRRHEHFIHGHRRAAVAADTPLVCPRLSQRLAVADADVLDRVMRIHLQIAGSLDGQVNQAVLGQKGEHMVEEADPGLDISAAGAVEFEG